MDKGVGGMLCLAHLFEGIHMRFQITMNMPSRSGNSVHQIIGEHPAKSLEELTDIMSHADFVIVDEIYKDNGAVAGNANFYSVGKIAINPLFIGKVKVFTA
jgi:hypothetical protein